jgi:hypothetical protein
MKVAIPLSLALLVSVQTALAQSAGPPTPSDTPSETVNVEAKRTPLEQGIHDFVTTYAQPTLFLGKIARWREGICPETQGFVEPLAASVTQRLREVAAKIGAPVNPDPHCKPNTLIYFTREPQSLLNELVKRNDDFLGFHNVSQTAALATITHPIQAWYATATRDADGRLNLDVADNHYTEECGRGLSDMFRRMPGLAVSLLKQCSYATEGNRGSLRDGLRSEFGRATIIGDSSKLDDYDTDTLADYVTMLALSQVDAFTTCQEMPTITNLLVPGCGEEHKTKGLSEIDLAYLRALYHSDPDLSLQLQQTAIAHQIEGTLKGK